MAKENEVLLMLTGDVDDITIGRTSLELEASEFDAWPPFDSQVDPATNPDLFSDTFTPDEVGDPEDKLLPTFLSGDEEAAEFEAPAPEMFPTFKRALAHFRANEPKDRVVRVDNEETYTDLIGDATVRELGRRISELRNVVEEHLSDGHGAPHEALSKWEVLGAAQAIQDLRSADSVDDAADALPAVPLDLPDFAKSAVRCWKDGDYVVVSVSFGVPDGSKRFATAAAKPRVDADELTGWAMNQGINPMSILGYVTEAAHSACGKKLVRDIAGAALQAQRRFDVCGMDGPVILTGLADETHAPLAALMYVQQRADGGDRQAQREMRLMHAAARTPAGKKIAAPMLAESNRRLEHGRKALGSAMKQLYAAGAGWR